MMALLKWTTVAYLGVLGLTAVSFPMYAVFKPAAIIVLGALTPVLLPPILLVLAAAPGTAPVFQLVVAAAIAIYVWLLGLMCFGWILKARSERVGPYRRWRRPGVAMY